MPAASANREQPNRRLSALAGHFQADIYDTSGDALLSRNLAEAQTDIAYAVPLPEKLSDDETWTVYRSTLSPQALVTSFPPPDGHIGTLYDNLEVTVARHPKVPALGSRSKNADGQLGPYRFKTYAEVAEIRTMLGSGLLHFGVQPAAAVGIYSVNCEEWVLLDMALHAYSMVSVPLYDTLGPDTVEFISSHADLSAVGCSAAVLPTMLECLPKCPTVRLVVVWGAPSSQLPAVPVGSGCRLVSFRELMLAGQQHPSPHVPPRPPTTALICYTSGTTGVPKGAVMSHGNLIANAAGVAPILQAYVEPGVRHISYLPLAHIYERVNLVSVLHTGCTVGFYSGCIDTLLDDIQELQPHLFCSVPRLWNRIYDRVMLQVRSGSVVTRKLFQLAYDSKLAAIKAGRIDAWSGSAVGRVWDRLVFSKIKAKLGGRVRLMCTGASPISEEVFDFLRVCFGAAVLEGYGMTETSCTITMSAAGDPLSGHVGGPLPSCEVKLADIPEMNYTQRSRPHPQGEICVRGPIVFQGYQKDEAQTREVLDADGWFHTGDVGMWLPGGRLKIIDRKKNIFKLAQGEYIAPEKIENIYMRSPLVAQVFVHGDSLKPQLVCVAVPDPEVLLPWAQERGMAPDLAQLCAEPSVQSTLLRAMQEEGRAAKLKGFEQVQAVHVSPEPFSMENGLLTPTFKLKRPQAKRVFASAIAALYAELERK